jgi:hypothetical protein
MPRKPLRKPTSAELRRAVEAFGGRDAFIRRVDEALSETKPRRGRERYEDRYTDDTLMRLLEAKPKDRTRIFQQLIDEGRIRGVTSNRKSLVERARRNFKKAEKPLAEAASKFKAASDQLSQLAQRFTDSIRALIESTDRLKVRGYTRSLVTKTRGSHEAARGRSPSPPKRIRPRRRTRPSSL